MSSTQPTLYSRIQTNGITLHTALAGPEDGPLVILLHGFPDFLDCWHSQIDALAAAGFRVLAADQRGYNLSDKPCGVEAYDLDKVAADVIGLADSLGRKRFSLVGHDWGAAVGWWVAQHYPARLAHFVSLSAGHPALWREGMQINPAQRKRSFYVQLFQIPWLPEFVIRVQNYAPLAHAIQSTARKDAVTVSDLARYRQAWNQKGAMTAMLNWYRAIYRRRFPEAASYRIVVPTLLIWGMRDIYAEPELIDASVKLCDSGKIVRLDNATHWILADEPERVNELLLEFLRK